MIYLEVRGRVGITAGRTNTESRLLCRAAVNLLQVVRFALRWACTMLTSSTFHLSMIHFHPQERCYSFAICAPTSSRHGSSCSHLINYKKNIRFHSPQKCNLGFFGHLLSSLGTAVKRRTGNWERERAE